MVSREDLDKAYANTQAIYERRAGQFDKDRARDGRESEWLEAFTETIPDGGHILDLGCGMGEPIAAWLIAKGYRITGVDYSEPMLEIARNRFPKGTWIHQDMRALDVTGPFDGIISWHGSFHLSTDEQRALLPKLGGLLKSGGTLMLTIGPEEGEVTGTIGGETVYHASLAPEEYRSRLQVSGFLELTLNTNADEGPFVLIARK